MFFLLMCSLYGNQVRHYENTNSKASIEMQAVCLLVVLFLVFLVQMKKYHYSKILLCYRVPPFARGRVSVTNAGVAELGDAPGLGPGGLTAVGVRVPPPAPFCN